MAGLFFGSKKSGQCQTAELNRIPNCLERSNDRNLKNQYMLIKSLRLPIAIASAAVAVLVFSGCVDQPGVVVHPGYWGPGYVAPPPAPAVVVEPPGPVVVGPGPGPGPVVAPGPGPGP